MEFENKIDVEENYSDNYKVIIREIIDKYLINWKWFVLAFILSVLLAYYNLNFERSFYQATGTIKMSEKGGNDRSTLSVFEDLGIMGNTGDNIEDEVEILTSKSLITEVVKSLGLNIKFYTDKNKISKFLDDNLNRHSEFYERERYTDPPLKINFLLSDSIIFKTKSNFIITVNSINNFTFSKTDGSYQKRHAFGEKIITDFGDIILTPNLDLKKNNLVGKNILVNISSIQDVTNSYLGRLEVEPKSQYSSIITLRVKDSDKKKAEDFINTLVIKYNNRAIALKDKLTKNTSDFVTKRLQIISDELLSVDLTAESLKTRYRISDEASDASLNMQSGQAVENKIVETTTQLQKIDFIKGFVNSKSNNDLIPLDVGIPDNNVSQSMQKYNDLMLEKQRLLENSTDKNPIVVNIDEQLKNLNSNIKQGLDNIETTQKISLDALNKQDAIINSRLYSAPKQERQYRDIKRQQQIKEALYLYLLQKREETAITLGVVDSNAKIIDYAESSAGPISPKKMLSYFSTILMGMLIPLGIIYFRDLLNTKVHTRDDIEKALKIPIVGDIPKEPKNRYLIKTDDYSSTAEAFRILRTNLSFILPDSKGNKKSNTIFITSTIAHEGKSLVATNLATTLAHAGKKTIILGMDIRAPKIKSYLGVRGKHGVTNYIVKSNIKPEDIILSVPETENLFVASSGDLAPNPAELLMNPRVKELFEFCKENFDYVIVDTAAYSMVTDTLIISHFADAFIYVIRANFLDKRYLKFINGLYKSKRLPNMALLINGIDFKKAYAYGYGYGYGSKFEATKNIWSKLRKTKK